MSIAVSISAVNEMRRQDQRPAPEFIEIFVRLGRGRRLRDDRVQAGPRFGLGQLPPVYWFQRLLERPGREDREHGIRTALKRNVQTFVRATAALAGSFTKMAVEASSPSKASAVPFRPAGRRPTPGGPTWRRSSPVGRRPSRLRGPTPRARVGRTSPGGPIPARLASARGWRSFARIRQRDRVTLMTRSLKASGVVRQSRTRNRSPRNRANRNRSSAVVAAGSAPPGRARPPSRVRSRPAGTASNPSAPGSGRPRTTA